MALHCPATLHLLAPGEESRVRADVESLGSERIVAVWSSGAPEASEAAAAAETAARFLDVPHRADPDLTGLAVAGFGHGAHPDRHCADGLDAIADQHRGEHVLVIGDVVAGAGEATLRRLEIGDDGWGPLT